MSLSSFSLKRPVTTLMITLSVLVVGFVALERLPMESFPSISSSGITARVQYNNSSPEEIERLITLPLEQTLGSLNNIDRISASSGRNQGEVRVDFVAGTDMDLANMEVRERVDQPLPLHRRTRGHPAPPRRGHPGGGGRDHRRGVDANRRGDPCPPALPWSAALRLAFLLGFWPPRV